MAMRASGNFKNEADPTHENEKTYIWREAQAPAVDITYS